MLKHRIIPILLTDGQGNCVKPVRFQRPYRKVGSLMQYVKMFEKRNIDELIVIDIEATNENRLIDCEKIKEYTKELFCPLTIGGGIRSLEDINKLLKSGADKVSIKTNYQIIPEASKKFGKQCIVYSVDAEPYCLIDKLIQDVKVMEERGAGEILLNKTNRDGMMAGYDLNIINAVAQTVSIPVIAAGGCNVLKDMKEAIDAGASGVAASSIFLYTDTTPKDCAEYLKNVGIEVRI